VPDIKPFVEKKYYGSILFGSAIILVLWVSKTYSFLLFHSFAELFSIVVACGIFILAWNSRHFTKNHYLLLIGIAYLFVGVLDLLHTLAYKGMGVFAGYDANLPTQLWIAARYLESLSLLIAPFVIYRKLNINAVFSGYTALLSILLLSIFYWQVFPDCFIEGSGLTLFKKTSEYIISLILAASIAALWKRRSEFERDVLRLITASIVLTIGAELAFTFYVSVYGLSNFVGHYLKIISFYLIYKAIIETGFMKPYKLLFRDLLKTEDALREAKNDLELKVHTRTIELTQTNEALRIEIEERRKAKKELKGYQESLKALISQLTVTEERDRRQIAADLHDHIGQSLALARIQLANAIKSTSDSGMKAILEDISKTLLKNTQDVRNIILELSSPSMNEIGLAAAISEWLEDQVGRRYGLETEFIDYIDDSQRITLNKDVRAVLFRNVRELLTNVIKHAQANKVKVSLEQEGDNLKVFVQDDGVGFDPHGLSSGMKCKGGFGLFSIQERMTELGGSLEVMSGPGKGCKAVLAMPGALCTHEVRV
jgi:signal transduction histidine kinase